MSLLKALKSVITRVPKPMLLVVVITSLLPFLFTLIGIDFGNHKEGLNFDDMGQQDPKLALELIFTSLAGSFTHLILEWTAVCAALFTAFFSFIHFSLKKDVTTPVVAAALFCAGCMDAFHALAAARLIGSVADINDFVPFTWALSRIFAITIVSAGIGIFLIKDAESWSGNWKVALGIPILFGFISYITIMVAANSTVLPQTTYPNAVITRPFDAIPLVMYIIVGIFVFIPFYKKHPSLFSSSLLISLIPEIAIEAHMAFGSRALFDSHFNAAHFLKIIAYLIPFIGLSLDYIRAYKVENLLEQIKKSEEDLSSRAMELSRSNEDLQKFAYVASHDLQEPLRMVNSFMQLLKEKYADQLDEKANMYINFATDGALRMQRLTHDLLKYSRVTTHGNTFEKVNLGEVLGEILQDLKILIDENKAEVSIPENKIIIDADRSQVRQLLQNFISNGIKFKKDGESPQIKVDFLERENDVLVSITDNGIGVDSKYFERIFVIFQRLHTREEYTGNGIGLAICKRIVERHGGTIVIESTLGEGTTFNFSLKKKHKER